MPEGRPPRCPNPDCPAPDRQTQLLRETEFEWVFACLTCGTVKVRTKPAGWKRAAYYRDLREGRTIVTSYDKTRIYSK